MIQQGSGAAGILCLTALIIILCLAATAAAQDVPDGEFRSDEHDLARFNGLIVDSIIIDNRNIYDTDLRKYDKFVYRTINSVRFKTRKFVVENEVILKQGQPFRSTWAEETARNLRRRLALYDAWVEVDPISDEHVIVTVVTIDQWSLAAGVDISRDGNEENYNINLSERNLLGRNQFVSFDYTLQSDDDNIVRFEFAEPRTLGRRIRTDFAYFDGPTAQGEQITLSRPFYDRLQETSVSATYSSVGGRRDTYEDSIRVARSRFDGDILNVDGAYRWGDYHRKWEVFGGYRYRYETTTARDTLAMPSETVRFAEDSLHHRFRLGLGWSDVRFVQTRRVDGFGYTEDFTLGFGLSGHFGRAFTRQFDARVYDVAGYNVSHAVRFGRNLLLTRYSQKYWFRGSSEFRRTTSLLANFYSRAGSFLTIAARLRYLSDWRSDGTGNLVLGGETGMRGLNTHTQTGDRLANLNLETRLFSGLEVLSVSIGGALFADVGRTWKARAPLKIRDFLFAGGFGFRFEAARSSRTRLVRIDVAYSEETGWQLSLGTGQYFSVPNLPFP